MSNRMPLHRPRLARGIAAIGMLTLLSACGASGARNDARVAPQAEQTVTPEMVLSAQQALAHGQLAEARNQFRAILSIDPKNGPAELGMGEVLLAGNDPSGAGEAFAAAAANPGLRARALQGKGLAELAQGRNDDAARDLTAALAADPSLWRAWNGLGLVHDYRQEWTEARAAYDHALANAPKTGAVHNNIGFSLLMQRNYAAAAAEFSAALAENPGLETAQNNQRLALAFQGRYGDALASLPKARRAAQLNNVGYVALLRRDYTAAETYLSRALEESPSYFDTAAQNLARLKAMASPTEKGPAVIKAEPQ